MNFNRHFNLEGLHAPFSASSSHWLRYDDEKAINTYMNAKAREMGSRYHAWAKETIDLRIKQPRSQKTLYAYINDAIGFRMATEVVLYYSDNFFGTADAISFEKNFLRVHDLKTGKEKASMEQLHVYVALFCLEYRVRPSELKGIECRIYQNDEVIIDQPTPEDIVPIMDKIVHLDKVINQIEYQEG